MDRCTVCGELVSLADEPVERTSAIIFVCSGCWECMPPETLRLTPVASAAGRGTGSRRR